jgi:hypothetical protein
MAKVDLASNVTGGASVVANAIPDSQKNPRHNLWCDGNYVTTVRAKTFEEACKLAAVDHPGKTFVGPPLDTSKQKKRKDSQRKNLFVMQDGQPVYFSTEIADTHADAKAQAQAKHPRVELLCEDDI